MKHLEAVKCQDGWLCYVTESYQIHFEGDIYKFALQNGLHKFTSVLEDCKACRNAKKKTCNHLKEIIKIIAE